MKKFISIIFKHIDNIVIVLLILLSTTVTIFNRNNDKEEIDEIHSQIKELNDNNSDIKDSILAYKIELKKFEIQNRILQAQKDSLIYSLKRNNAKDWQDLQNIKGKQAELNTLLEKLRKSNNAFN